MKIGILTFHKPINYGAFLQSFSLSNKLAERFPDSEVSIIDYIAPEEKAKIYINVLRTLKHEGVKNTFKEIKKVRVFKKSQQYLKTTKKVNCKKNLDNLYKWIDESFDVLVIGSDAVFNWNQNGYPTAFIPNYRFEHCKVLTYAASVHGLKFKSEPFERLVECKTAFDSMSFIGVRDACTEKFVSHTGATLAPVHCCDPTVFIDTEKVIELAGNYKERVMKKYNLSLEGKYVVLMMQDSDISEAVVKKISKEYKIISLFKNSRYADSFLYDLNPFEWVAVLKNASLVVTSYFHGTLLSLVNKTPVVVIDHSHYTDEYYEGKLKDFMCARISVPELFFEREKVNINSLIEVCDKAICGEYNEKIAIGIAQERKSADAFMNYLMSMQ